MKKYYFPLWRALPEDYMTSLSKISAQLPLRDDAVNLITSQTNSIGANKSILDVLIMFRGYDSDLIEFCSILEAVIGDEQKVAQVVEPLRQGWYTYVVYAIWYCIKVCITYIHKKCKTLTMEKSDKFDKWQAIRQSFPFQSFPCNTFPMKATINLSKFCLSNFLTCLIYQIQTFPLSKFCAIQYVHMYIHTFQVLYNVVCFTGIATCTIKCTCLALDELQLCRSGAYIITLYTSGYTCIVVLENTYVHGHLLSLQNAYS